MQTLSDINRRKFLQWAGISGTALILGCRQNGPKSAGPIVSILDQSDPGTKIRPFIAIGQDGIITFFNPRPEMGQGTHQSIPALIAEELEVDLDTIRVRHTGGEPEFGDGQWVGGSEAVKSDYTLMRKVGASARMMLVEAAAAQWKVPANSCFAENGSVVHRPTGKKAGYGALAAAATLLPVPASPVLKDLKDFKILGKSPVRNDIRQKINGQAEYGIDTAVPGMVYASILRCPVFGGQLIRYDATAAMAVPGVESVHPVERIIGRHRSQGIAVVATQYWAAIKGRNALQVEWDYQGNDRFNSDAYAAELRQLSRQKGLTEHAKGQFDKAYSSSPTQLEAFYETPVVTHSTLEPMNCLAHWQEGNKVEIWTSTQVPGDVYQRIPEIFNIPAGHITLHNGFIGGGFGRRLYLDFIVEAVGLSKSIGKPVKVIWTREEDIQNGPFRPMTFSLLQAGLDVLGKPNAMLHKVIAPSLQASDNADFAWNQLDDWMTEGIGKQPYEIPHLLVKYVPAPFHIPIVAWRSVTSSTVAFAHECFLDEMAVKAGKDPMHYRLDLLSKPSDVKKVLERLRSFSKWDEPLPKGWGRGVAQWEFFAGLAGEVVEVSTTAAGGVKVEKVYVVIDLGTVVHPDNVRAQMEGSVAMALSAAIKNGITFSEGKVVQSNFHDNPVIRIDEMPEVMVDIITEEGARIKGVGEPGLPPFAPALCNAIYHATGVRIRKLPVDLQNIQAEG